MKRTTIQTLGLGLVVGFLLTAGALAQSFEKKSGFGSEREAQDVVIRVDSATTVITGSLSSSDDPFNGPRGSTTFSPSCTAPPNGPTGNRRADVYPFQVVSAGNFVAGVTSGDFDTVLALYCSYDPANASGNLLIVDDDGGTGFNSAFSGSDNIALVPGVTYYLVVSSYDTGSAGLGAYTLTIQPEVRFLSGLDCTLGPDLAASILYPYFEVDLGDVGGINTLLSASNWSSSPALTRVTVWNDWGKPTLAFDVYLEANDVQTFSVRDLLNGSIPSTGASADLSGFPGCDTAPPNGYPSGGPFPSGQISQIQAYHTGVSGDLDAMCSGEPVGDGIARGYVTIDNVTACSGAEGFNPQATPANTDYQNNTLGFQNVLGGDLILVEPAEASAQGYDVVHLPADPRNLGFITFYGQYNGNTGIDRRNPLPTGSNVRFLNGGPFGGGADVLQWLSNLSADTSSVTCGQRPSWYPNRIDVTAFDEEAGNQVTFANTNRFPRVAQRVPITSFSNIPNFGMLRLDNDVQSWSYVILKAGGLYSGGWSGISEPGDALCGVAAP